MRTLMANKTVDSKKYRHGNPISKTIRGMAYTLSDTKNYKEKITNSVKRNVIGFYSPYDGAGKTTLIINVAYVLASMGCSVCVVDLDFIRPDVFRYLKPKALINPNDEISTIRTKIMNSNYPITECINRSIIKQINFISSSPDEHAIAYMSQGNSDEQKEQELDTILKIYSELSPIYDFVLLDLKNDITETTTVVAMKVCDHFITVFDGTVRSLENIIKSNKEFEPMNFKNKFNNFVITKSSGNMISEKDMKEIIPNSTIVANIPYSDAVLSSGNSLSIFMKDSKKSDAITQYTRESITKIANIIFKSVAIDDFAARGGVTYVKPITGKNTLKIRLADIDTAPEEDIAVESFERAEEVSNEVKEPAMKSVVSDEEYEETVYEEEPVYEEKVQFVSSFADVKASDFLLVPNLKIINGKVLVCGEREI